FSGSAAFYPALTIAEDTSDPPLLLKVTVYSLISVSLLHETRRENAIIKAVHTNNVFLFICYPSSVVKIS
ncbi:MAG: hypothetical protein SPJ34_04985, partial [Candidatus Ornithospirochaeta sp.]|nr:hypothetical protein [Candidatus Ornithospirochaeta sp.]